MMGGWTKLGVGNELASADTPYVSAIGISILTTNDDDDAQCSSVQVLSPMDASTFYGMI